MHPFCVKPFAYCVAITVRSDRVNSQMPGSCARAANAGALQTNVLVPAYVYLCTEALSACQLTFIINSYIGNKSKLI